jgi:outer membrane receptor protein involved in Fe transport
MNGCFETSGVESRGRKGQVSFLLASTVAVIALMAPTAAQAQAAAATNIDPATQEIIVTAGKREQALSTVPQGISVVTGAQISARAAKSLADYIALTPGLSLVSTGAPGSGAVEIRGIPPLVVAGTVATYVDEVPISGSSGAAFGGRSQPDLDPSDMDHIEVLKGPQGTLYGATSLGGVIKYVLKKPSLTNTEVNTTEELNAYDNGHLGTRLSGAVTTPLINDTLGIRVSGYYRHDAGYIDDVGFGGKAVNDGNSWGARGALYWKPTSNFSVDLSALVQDSTYYGFAATDLDWQSFQPLYGWDKVSRSTPENGRVHTNVFGATLKWDTEYGTLLSSSGYSTDKRHSTTDITYDYAFPGTPIDYSTPAAVVPTALTKQFSQEVRFASKRFGPLDFIAGGFYQHAHYDSDRNFINFSLAGLPLYSSNLGQNYVTSSLNEYAGFINATVHLTDQLDVTGGYRHSHITQSGTTIQGGYFYGLPDLSRVQSSSSKENADTYLGGVRWRPTSGVMFYVRAASGYRPGGTRSLPPGAPADFGNTFKSDSIWSYEAGTKINLFSGRVTFEADAFRIDWKDIQTLVFFGPFSTTGNAGKARSQGGEIQASFEPVKGLVLSGNAAYTDAKYTEDSAQILVTKGEHLPYVPKWTATGEVDYSWSLNERLKAHVSGDYDYKSSMIDNGAEFYTIPGFATINLRAGIETDKHWTFNLYVKNVTNKRAIVGTEQGYYTFFNPFVVTVNEPRSYGISLSQKF